MILEDLQQSGAVMSKPATSFSGGYTFEAHILGMSKTGLTFGLLFVT